MKKLPAFVLTLTLLLAITCGCSSNAPNNSTPSNTPQTDTNQPDLPPEDTTQPDTPPEEPAVPYGECGENLSWNFAEDGTLTITGTGKMEDSAQPWSNYLESITTVVIEEGTTTIGSGAFAGCANLASIVIPDSMVIIGDSAFSGCSSLTSVDIPGSVKIIGDSAFDGCTALTDVSYSGDDWAWSGISVGEGNDCLTNAAFTYAIAEGTCGENLTWTLTYDGTLTISGLGQMDDGISTIDGLPMITRGPWIDHWESITRIVINEGVTSIGSYAFFECTNLTSVEIPSSVTTIGAWAFRECTSLASVTIQNGLNTIGECAFFNCTSLTSIEIPSSVTSIGESALNRCSSLTSIKIPNGVTTIEKSTFYECTSLTSVYIPSSVTTIGFWSFIGCNAIGTVYFDGTKDQWNAIVFDEGNNSLLNAEIVFK